MTLYTAETANITVTGGTINNGSGLPITTSPNTPANLAWTHITISAGTLSSPCLFTCTITTLGSSGTLTANLSVTDTYGNTESTLGAGHTVTVTTPTSGAGRGGSFTAPTAGTSVNLTIGPAGTADSTIQFTFQAQNGVWVSEHNYRPNTRRHPVHKRHRNPQNIGSLCYTSGHDGLVKPGLLRSAGARAVVGHRGHPRVPKRLRRTRRSR